MTAPQLRRWRPPGPVDVARVLRLHQRGPYDPTHQVLPDGTVWRTCRPFGEPATVRITPPAHGEIEVFAWGPGASAALELVPSWLGAEDDATGFDPEHPVLRRAVHDHPGLRIGRTSLVMEALVPAVLEQKVTSVEAWRGWAAMLRRIGEPAPGSGVVAQMPAGMRVVPTARAWAAVPSWTWHRAGVGPERSRTIVGLGPVASRLERLHERPTAEADVALRSLPGIGVWTSAETRQRAMGDSDAVSVGDYALPSLVTYALTGEERRDDDVMLELLEPYRGHRYRACAFLIAAAPRPPRRAPRAPIRDYRFS